MLRYQQQPMPSTDRILKYQKIYQSKPNVPLWMRTPRSKLIVYPFYALFAYSCVAMPLYYTGLAMAGKKNE
ncbi:cytochrome c oxidase subunit VII [Starmerella bacillaris]|uniref:Cytochrome c oxidase subunit VII n=1 Tax=Starmerella bacillaris TaxID=1247836 RepID=A0AAV5RGF9_STABA|nr:cytochrome c oxidase subunit VII [Starmerella bacillaris]